MSFINFPSPTPIFPVLPPLTWSVHKKPIMGYRVVTAVSGREVQFAGAVYPRWNFLLSYGNGNSWLRDQTQNIVVGPNAIGYTELQQISGLFLLCQGSYGEFYYSDPNDNSRSNQSVGVGNGSQTIFPLYYSWGSGPFTPKMTIPVGGIQTINNVYLNGIVQLAASYSMDATNTKLVFSTSGSYTAPPNGSIITADFSFYFRCRFMEDNLLFEEFAQNLWDTKEVRFESVKP
jgi:uncharacterized protein (TIGR02217 family)